MGCLQAAEVSWEVFSMSERVLESSASQGRAGKHPRSAPFLDGGEGWFPPVWTRERTGILGRGVRKGLGFGLSLSG